MPPISEDESFFLLVNSGTGTITVNGVVFELSAGNFCWLQAYHTFTIAPKWGNALDISVCVFDYALSSFLTFREQDPSVTLAVISVPPVLSLEGEQLEKVEQLFQEFKAEDMCFDGGSSLIKVSILGQLSIIFIQNGVKRIKSEKKIQRPLGWKANLFIAAHCTEDISAEEVSDFFKTDTATLNRELRKVSGNNFAQILNRARVNIAAAAMLFDGLSLAYIASRSGFASEVAFYRSFKKQMGVTPQEYREQSLNSTEGVYRGMIMSTTLMTVLNYVSENFSEQINMKDMAQELYTSESIIRDLLKDKLNKSYKDVIAINRIRYAEALLLTTDLPILDIAVDVGYNSNRTLSRVFREINSMTPSEYRGRFRNGD